jgi:hypothetical protein
MTESALGAVRAPDLVHAVIGYRQWRVHDGELWSPYTPEPWRRGVKTAVCRAAAAPHSGPAPGHDCTCGIHAWYRPCPRLASPSTSDLVAGAVALWGEVELHATRLRAQYGMVVALVRPLLGGPKRREIVRAAAALEVEVVPAHHLEAVALRYGLPVPPGLAPPVTSSPAAQALDRLRANPDEGWRPSSLVAARHPSEPP